MESLGIRRILADFDSPVQSYKANPANMILDMILDMILHVTLGMILNMILVKKYVSGQKLESAYVRKLKHTNIPNRWTAKFAPCSIFKSLSTKEDSKERTKSIQTCESLLRRLHSSYITEQI